MSSDLVTPDTTSWPITSMPPYTMVTRSDTPSYCIWFLNIKLVRGDFMKLVINLNSVSKFIILCIFSFNILVRIKRKKLFSKTLNPAIPHNSKADNPTMSHLSKTVKQTCLIFLRQGTPISPHLSKSVNPTMLHIFKTEHYTVPSLQDREPHIVLSF